MFIPFRMVFLDFMHWAQQSCHRLKQFVKCVVWNLANVSCDLPWIMVMSLNIPPCNTVLSYGKESCHMPLNLVKMEVLEWQSFYFRQKFAHKQSRASRYIVMLEEKSLEFHFSVSFLTIYSPAGSVKCHCNNVDLWFVYMVRIHNA